MEISNKKKCSAIVLSAGQGKRMGTTVSKQYIELEGKPIIAHTLEVFQKSEIIDEIILVVGAGQIEYAKNDIVKPYGFTKVTSIVEGGKERYDSVWMGIQAIENTSYVFIHDGARLFVSEEILERGYACVEEFEACVAGMPSKDTIKLVDEETFVSETPARKYVWAVQTPQIFTYPLIKEAYARLMEADVENITDDAMVVEQMMGRKVKLFYGSYENIKITTPEDLEIAKVFLK